MATHSESRLVSIPPELLLKITSNLTTPEYANLRLTCKHIEATLFSSFSREFFTKRQFMFTEFSLQALVDISKSRLSSCLKHLIFGLERPSLPPSPGANLATASKEQLLQYNNSLQAFYGHVALLNTGQDVEMIAEALSNLRNLEIVGMRDFYSHSRDRDFPNSAWKSYGVSAFEEETGRRLEMPRRHGSYDQAPYINRIFLNIFRALGQSGSQLKRFEAILRNSTLNDQTFNIPKRVQPVVCPVLTNLKTIFLELNFEYPPTYVDTDNGPAECPSYFSRMLISNFTQLEHLRLNFYFHPSSNITDFMSWMGKPAREAPPSSASAIIAPPVLLPEAPQPTSFTSLRQLDIGMVTIEPQCLLSIIRKCRKTLRTISFHKVALLEDPSSVKLKDRVNLWITLFEDISSLNVNLTTINLSYISQNRSMQSLPVGFGDSSTSKSTSSLKSWVGPDVQKGLKEIISSIIVQGLNYESNSDNGDDSDDDSDDSMVDVDDAVDTEDDEDD